MLFWSSQLLLTGKNLDEEENDLISSTDQFYQILTSNYKSMAVGKEN